MKKNLGLFLVFSLLFYVTYQFEEIGQAEKIKKNKSDSKVFNFKKLGNIRELITPNAHLVWRDNKVFDKENGIIISKNALHMLLDVLGNIHIKRDLTEKNSNNNSLSLKTDFLGKDPLKFTFHFEHGSASFTLGKKLEYSQDFYMFVEISGQEGRMIIGQDKMPLEGIYQKEGFETNDKKYKRLLSLLYLNNEYFHERLVFSNLIDKKSLIQIGFESFRNPKFSLNLIGNKSYPKAPNGIKINHNKIEKLVEELKNLRASKVFKLKNRDQLRNGRGKIYFQYKKNRFLEFEIYSSYLLEEGTFIKRNDQVFKIEDKFSSILFSNLQEFWIKKFPLDSSEQQLDFKINSKKKISLKINQKILKEKIGDKKDQVMSGVLNYFNLEADKVSLVDLDIKRLLSSKEDNHNILNFLVDGNPFALVFSDNETKIINIAKNYVLHYFGNDTETLINFFNKYKVK